MRRPKSARAAEPATAASAGARRQSKHGFYRESWAVMIGINDYEHWPKLRYAVNDANGIEKR